MATTQQPASETLEPVHILYFEDNATDSILAQTYLEAVPSMRARFTVVDRLAAGLRLLEHQKFDVALLDLNLPDSRGLQSLDLLRHKAPKLPIVVISGVVDDRLALDLLDHGAQDCLAKGDGLAARIANAIRFAIHRQQTETELALRVQKIEASKAYSESLLKGLERVSAHDGEVHAQSILAASLDAVVVVDESGLVRYLNPAAERMLCQPASELISQPFGLPIVSGPSTEIELSGSDSKTYTVEMRVKEVDWDGQGAQLLWLRDISEHKRQEEATVRSEKLQALGTLAGGIAHDFNNILLTVSGNAKLALGQLPADHAAHSYVLEIAKAGSRAAALTKKILSFSDREETKLQTTPVVPVVDEALSHVRTLLPERIEIRADFPPDLPPISADASQLRQAILNLATNAADAIGDNPGVLEVTASSIHVNDKGSNLSNRLPSGPYVKLAVKDTGAGMEKSTLGRIFEPFFTTKSQGRGTGMGLSVVHGIMKNHCGEVTAYSEPGKGSVFNLYFPAAEAAPSEFVAEPQELPVQGKGRRILYVDDEEPLVLLITRTLKRLGYAVTGFLDPLQALHALREHPQDFDALVTDLSMPAMSGTDLAREALQVRADLPVILTSGYVRPQDQEIARRIGVREVILKPDTVEDLGDVLHRLLDQEAGPPLAAAAGQGK